MRIAQLTNHSGWYGTNQFTFCVNLISNSEEFTWWCRGSYTPRVEAILFWRDRADMRLVYDNQAINR